MFIQMGVMERGGGVRVKVDTIMTVVKRSPNETKYSSYMSYNKSWNERG